MPVERAPGLAKGTHMHRRRPKKQSLNALEVLQKLAIKHDKMRKGKKKEFAGKVIDALVEDLFLRMHPEEHRVSIEHEGMPVRGSTGLLEELLKDV